MQLRRALRAAQLRKPLVRLQQCWMRWASQAPSLLLAGQEEGHMRWRVLPSCQTDVWAPPRLLVSARTACQTLIFSREWDRRMSTNLVLL